MEVTKEQIVAEFNNRNYYGKVAEEEDKKTSKATIAGVVMAAIALVMMTGK